ncbi:tRNA (cytosine(38)-C(5))-methyltransferase 2 (AtDNMT2) (DNA (cytosine-5)-methyltransferase-like protein 2) (Dnmt2) [Durusdinium trenchii]
MAFQSEQPRVHPLETEFPGLLESPENRQLSEYLQLQKEHQSVPERLLDLLWEKGQRWEVVTPNSTSSSTFTSGYTTPCFDAHRFGPLLATDAEGRPELEPRHLPGGRVQRLVAPGEDVRYFTPLELLQIHGFPKSFHFPETVTEHQRYKLIGDSISVDVVAELLRYLLFEKIKAASS